jgi:hypothetical protein
MADFDKQKAADWIVQNAVPKYGVGLCAKHVRLALEAGGLNTTGHPRDAKDWGPTLIRNGFIATNDPVPKLGDVAVIQPPTNPKCAAGHMEYYNGKNWTSDFIQDEFWPGQSWKKDDPDYTIYRLP